MPPKRVFSVSCFNKNRCISEQSSEDFFWRLQKQTMMMKIFHIIEDPIVNSSYGSIDAESLVSITLIEISLKDNKGTSPLGILP